MMRTIIGKIHQADLDYGLIADGDRIAIGLSGGKDSTLLLDALDRYRNFARAHDQKEFTVVGIHLDMGFAPVDMTPLETFAASRHLEYHTEKTPIYDILKLHPEPDGGISCSRCSQLKKGAMIKAAKNLGCNKTAFAHHGDDAIETLFMNMIYGGRIRTFQPKMYMDRSGMTFIRPLIYCFEDEIAKAVRQEALPVLPSRCPNDGNTARQKIKEQLAALYAADPKAHLNFLRALHNPAQVQLFKNEK